MFVSLVVLVQAFEERNKEGSGRFRIAAPVAKLSSLIDEASYLVRNVSREKEREREKSQDIYFARIFLFSPRRFFHTTELFHLPLKTLLCFLRLATREI